MSKASALQTWFSGFGLTAYEESNVKVSPTFPYLTYTYATGDFDSGEVPIIVNLWYRTEGNSAINAKSEEIYSRIGRGGVIIPVENGSIWLKRGSPFCQALAEPSDANIRRRYINITAEFRTA
jgi:hypothetical protein